ncbi:MAG: pilus assembly protein PilP [Proteobacteria bacterium]|nr:pilus assembly protein PilP [Pseudomonadota bacterium]
MSRYIDRSFLPVLSSTFTKLLLVVSVCFCTLSLMLNIAVSADNDTAEQVTPSELNKVTPFEYKLENRPDPFVPFITEKAASSNVNMDEVIDNGEPLTGMQLFEPGQLTLVALIKKGSESMAMVQDSSGKGYVISQGTKIGRRGLVKDFTPQSVIVEETAVTRAGKKTVTEVVMLLKKEGEK